MSKILYTIKMIFKELWEHKGISLLILIYFTFLSLYFMSELPIDFSCESCKNFIENEFGDILITVILYVSINIIIRNNLSDDASQRMSDINDIILLTFAFVKIPLKLIIVPFIENYISTAFVTEYKVVILLSLILLFILIFLVLVSIITSLFSKKKKSHWYAGNHRRRKKTS